ncbi:hypothetical protein [Coleofasciculus sp. E2-BRE-01]|uniref:hypothetical protein n=1 Tax=Coleofasciculus sp. E2-BRE-01 TaxID=3069524 RepID=UPI0040648A15
MLHGIAHEKSYPRSGYTGMVFLIFTTFRQTVDRESTQFLEDGGEFFGKITDTEAGELLAFS